MSNNINLVKQSISSCNKNELKAMQSNIAALTGSERKALSVVFSILELNRTQQKELFSVACKGLDDEEVLNLYQKLNTSKTGILAQIESIVDSILDLFRSHDSKTSVLSAQLYLYNARVQANVTK